MSGMTGERVDTMTDKTTENWEQRLRDNGFRITPQRQLVLQAVSYTHLTLPTILLV